MKRLLPALFVFVSLLAAPAIAQDFAKGYSAYATGDYAGALREWRALAEQGNARAQHNIGLMYAKGRGVPKDYAAAMKWYRMAAEQDNPHAQTAIGVMYYKGEGVPKDYAEARKWYRLAVKQGFAAAQYNLAIMYFGGRDVPRDFVQAHTLFSLALAQGDENGQIGRDVVVKEVTTEQILEAQRRAREWLKANPQ